MKFRPLHDRVVLKRLEEDAKTAGGIIIPDTVKEKPMQRRNRRCRPRCCATTPARSYRSI